MAFTKIVDADLVNKGVIGLPDQPGLSTAAMQAKLEETARSVVIPKHNSLIDELEDATAASSLGATALIGRASSPNVQAVMEKLSTDLKTVEDGMAEAIADAHTHDNKALLDTYEQTETDLADAVSKKHDHSNKSLLDSYTQTEANLSDAVSKKHDHSNKALLDSYTQTETDLAQAVADDHTHSNKTVLDKFGESGGNPTYDGNPIGGGGGSYTAGDGIDITGTTISLDLGLLTSSNLTKAVAGSDIKTALDAKQDTLTFDNTPTASSNNPVKSQGIKTYADTSQSGALSDIKSTVGWDGKNLLPFKLSRIKELATSGDGYTWNGNVCSKYGVALTFSVDENGYVTEIDIDSNGSQTTGNVYLVCLSWKEFTPLEKGYVLSGVNGTADYYVYANRRLGDAGSPNYNVNTRNGDNTFTVDYTEYNQFEWGVGVLTGKVYNHVKLYPMLRDASITDSTFEPYHKSVEDTISDVYGVMGVNGARNYITPDFAIKSLSAASDYGVAYSATQGIITLDGTATANNTIAFHYRSGLSGENSPIILPKGKYRIGKNDTNVSYEVVKTVNGSKSVIVTLGKNAKSVDFELTEETQIGLGLIFENGQVFDDFVTTPYLCQASDTYNDFTPYAMTNRELTEVHTGTITDIPGTVESDTYTKKQGNVVDVWIRSNGVTISANDYIGTLPSGFRPSADIIVTIFGTSSNKIVRGWVNSTNGKITCTEALTNDNIRCQFSFIA